MLISQAELVQWQAVCWARMSWPELQWELVVCEIEMLKPRITKREKNSTDSNISNFVILKRQHNLFDFF